jgi:sulfatase modifying factor 1
MKSLGAMAACLLVAVASCSSSNGAGSSMTPDASMASSNQDSGAGSDAGLEDGSDAACTAATLRCNGPQRQTCVSGLWFDTGAACPGGCLEGVCVPCTPGATQCNGAQPQTCDASGSWQDRGGACARQTCSAGTCVGVCGQGQTNCNGQQPQTCDPTGHWEDSGASCSASQPCANGSCSGVCIAGEQRCSSGNVSQVCSAAGQWVSTTCPGAAPACALAGCVADSPSCQAPGAGRTDCGAAVESCCTSLEVPGSTYFRTYPDPLSSVTNESDPATVSGFRLDKYDVTVGRFRQFVSAVLPPGGGAGWTPPPASGRHTHVNGGQGLANAGMEGGVESGWVTADDDSIAPTDSNLLSCADSTWTSSPGSGEGLPINCLNWFEAYAFCIWDGGFLPSEAEWELAASGGSQERAYPWGSTDPGMTNQYAIYGCDYNASDAGTCGLANIAPVGTATLGAGPWGHLDLAGNMEQWVLDWHDSVTNRLPTPCVDCAYLTPDMARVERGGRYDSAASQLLASFRGLQEQALRSGGMRCARTP